MLLYKLSSFCASNITKGRDLIQLKVGLSILITLVFLSKYIREQFQKRPEFNATSPLSYLYPNNFHNIGLWPPPHSTVMLWAAIVTDLLLWFMFNIWSVSIMNPQAIFNFKLLDFIDNIGSDKVYDFLLWGCINAGAGLSGLRCISIVGSKIPQGVDGDGFQDTNGGIH